MPLHENVVLLGGDRREVELYRRWREQGMKVKMAGFEHCPEVAKADIFTESDLQDAAVLIAPFPGSRKTAPFPPSMPAKPFQLSPS